MQRSGFTILELLIALAILGILGAIAVPLYQGYVETSQEGVMRSNIMTIEMFQEDHFLREGEYAVNLPDRQAITNRIGWDPRSDDGTTYSIAVGDGTGTSYQVTAIHPDGMTVCIDFPDRDDC